MTCKQFRASIKDPGRILGLTMEERWAYAHHYIRCPPCKAAVQAIPRPKDEEMAQLAEAIGYVIGTADASEFLRRQHIESN